VEWTHYQLVYLYRKGNNCPTTHTIYCVRIKYVWLKLNIAYISCHVPLPLLISGQQTHRACIPIVSNRQRCQAVSQYIVLARYHAYEGTRAHKCVTTVAWVNDITLAKVNTQTNIGADILYRVAIFLVILR